MKGTDSANNQLEDTAKHLFSIHGAALAAGTALGFLASQALANSVSAAADFEEAMVEVRKVTDRSTTNVRNLSGSLRDMAPRLGQSQDDLAEVAAMAGRMGFQGSENISRFTEQVSKMAVATNLATDEAARGFAKLIRQTDATEGEVRNIGAAVNALSNNMATSSDEIVEAATKGGAVLSQLGLRAEDVLALNASVAAISDSARRAGSRLRRLGQELMDPRRIEELSNTFGMTGDQFRRLRDESPVELILSLAKTMREGGDAGEKLNEILSTQSAQSLSIMGANLENTREALELSSEQMENATSLQEEFQKANETLNFHLEQTNSLMNELAIQTGEGTNPVVLGLVESLNDLLRTLGEFNRATDGAIVSLGLLATAIGGVSLAIKAMITLFFQGSASIAGMTFTANTAAATFAGLAAVVAAIAVAWGTNFANIRDSTTRALADMEESLGRFVATLSGASDKTDREMRSMTDRIIDGFVRRVSAGLDIIMVGLATMVDATTTALSNLVRASIQSGKAIKEALSGNIMEADRILREEIMRTLEEAQDLRERTLQRGENLGLRVQRLRLEERGITPPEEGEESGRSEDEVTESLEDILNKLPEDQERRLRNILSGQIKTEENTAEIARNTRDMSNLKDILRVISVRTGQFPTEQEIQRAVSDGTLDATELTQLFGADATRRDVISALRTVAQKPGMELSNSELQKIVSDNRITSNELRKWLPKIALNSRNTSSALQESDVIQGDACDLRDFLLGPFERVGQPGDGQQQEQQLPGDPLDVSVIDGPPTPTTPQDMVDRTKTAVSDAMAGKLKGTEIKNAVDDQTRKTTDKLNKGNELVRQTKDAILKALGATSEEPPQPGDAPPVDLFEQTEGIVNDNLSDGLSRTDIGKQVSDAVVPGEDSSRRLFQQYQNSVVPDESTSKSLQQEVKDSFRVEKGEIFDSLQISKEDVVGPLRINEPVVPKEINNAFRRAVPDRFDLSGLFGGRTPQDPPGQSQRGREREREAFKQTVAAGVEQGVEQALSGQETDIHIDGKKITESIQQAENRYFGPRSVSGL